MAIHRLHRVPLWFEKRPVDRREDGPGQVNGRRDCLSEGTSPDVRDWTTALAGYNCGEWAVMNRIKTQKVNYLDNFWDLYVKLPHETAAYVPRFSQCFTL